jgi:predicted phage terminase large subunit-like protein
MSYGQELVEDLARKCQTVMAADWYKMAFDTRVSAGRRAVHDFHTTAHGYRRSSSLAGAVTGFGADFVIIDDPQKPGEALSDAVRSAANALFDNTILSRLNKKTDGCIIIVMQRIHEDDLVGHVLAQDAKQWDVVAPPAIAEKDEVHPYANAFGAGEHRRAEGEALHPDREPLSVLNEIRALQGSYLFEAQYQQRPAPRDGGIVDVRCFRRFNLDAPPPFDQRIQSWDTAVKDQDLHDFSVGTTWGRAGKHLYLLNVVRKRMSFLRLRDEIIKQAELFDPHAVLIEDSVSGTNMLEVLRREMNFGRAIAVKVEGSKVMRMRNQAALIESGFVHIPTEAPWLDAYLHELEAFDKGRHDDQVDSTSQALGWISAQICEPAITSYYRHQVEARDQQPAPVKMVRLRAPRHGMQIQLNGGAPLICADPDGLYTIPADQAAPLLASGWTPVA